MAQHRRPNGTGSVYQRQDGSWVASMVLNGKRVSRYRRNRKEAELALAALLAGTERSDGSCTLAGEARTLQVWVNQWLYTNAHRLRPKTLSNYRKALKPILESVGDVELSKLSALPLSNVLARMQQDGRGARSIQQSYTVLHTCLQAAVRFDLIITNPMAKVAKPSWHASDKRFWSVEETRRFIDTALASGRKWSPLCLFLVSTGLRTSEACGLTWDDVDLDHDRIRVSATQVYSDGEFFVGPPKSRSGRRSVSIDRVGAVAIRRMEADRHGAGVFRTREGNPPVPGVINRELKRLCIEAEVPALSPHGLRHVHAMLAFESTGDAYLVQRRLGHSHITTTLRLYGYSTRKDSSVADAHDQLLKRDIVD